MATALQRTLENPPVSRAGPLDALDLARRRFLHGDRLDMGDLARDLGVSRATLYRWVGDRELLLGEVLWSLAESGLEQARRHADAAAPGGGAAWVHSFVTKNIELTAGSVPIRRFVEADPELALRVLTSKHGVQQRRLIEALRQVLEERARRGELDLKLPAADLAYAIVRISESFI